MRLPKSAHTTTGEQRPASRFVGRPDQAERLFERRLALRDDVGLLAEEYDPDTGRHLGNTPQAFSLVGLVNSARQLSGTTTRTSAGTREQHARRR